MEAQLLLQLKEARKALLASSKVSIVPLLKFQPHPVYIPAANMTWSTAKRFLASYPTTFLHGVRYGFGPRKLTASLHLSRSTTTREYKYWY